MRSKDKTMSEIEKMYENVGVKKLLYCDICKAQEHALGLCAETKCEPFYPPFTAEKQIELIKLLAHKRNGFLLLAPTTDKNKFSTATDYYYGSFRTTVARLFKGIDETIAGLLNIIWQDLTEQERTEIKEILE